MNVKRGFSPIGIIVFLSTLWISLLASAQNAQQAVQTTPDWAEFISQVSGPLLSKSDSIRIGFVNPVVGPEQVGKAAKGMISSSPEIKAKIIFSAVNEITLVPQRPLSPGQTYQIELAAAQLSNIPPSLGAYTFSIHVREQALDIRFEGLSVNPTNEGEFNLRGNLVTADLADPQAIESVVNARFLNKGHLRKYKIFVKMNFSPAGIISNGTAWLFRYRKSHEKTR
jgi:hypothetical protein